MPDDHSQSLLMKCRRRLEFRNSGNQYRFSLLVAAYFDHLRSKDLVTGDPAQDTMLKNTFIGKVFLENNLFYFLPTSEREKEPLFCNLGQVISRQTHHLYVIFQKAEGGCFGGYRAEGKASEPYTPPFFLDI